MDIRHVQIAVSVLLMIILSVLDIKRKAVPAILVIIYLVIGIFFEILWGRWTDMFLTSLPGLLMIVLSFLSGEKIGYGDGITTCALGIWVGIGTTIVTLVVGMLSIGLVASSWIIIRKVRRLKVDGSERIPFIPFLLLGLAVSIIGEKAF